MFAHQSTEAWTTLCNSILGAGMNITGSWATDTEMTSALKTDKAFLASSVTVVAKPAQRQGIGEYREVKKAIERTVKREVGELYRLGFRGADLLTACFGPAVSEFGKYQLVEKADGTEVTVAELLEMARAAAFNAIVSDIETDDYTKFYLGWLNLFGFTQAEHDDVRRISQIGLNIDLKELANGKILVQDGKKQTLASFVERISGTKRLGEAANSYMIDRLHRAMHLYKGANRGALVQYIGETAGGMEHPFWRVLAALAEVLPAGAEDHKCAIGLMANKESLIRESLEARQAKPAQGSLFGEEAP
jgi:adenine-specific DNA methylase